MLLTSLSCLIGLLLACSACIAQLDASGSWQLFTAGKYGEYLQSLSSGQSGQSSSPEPNLQRIVAVAISLDKTKQWDTPVAAHAGSLFSGADAVRYFQATKRVITGDISGMSLYFEGTPPKYGLWREQAKVLRLNGYEKGADAFDAIYMTGSTGLGTPQDLRVVETGVTSLAAFSPEERNAMQDLISKRLDDGSNWYGKQRIATAALELCLRADPDKESVYLDIACKFGEGSGVFTVAKARGLLQAGKRDTAIKVALKAADDDREDWERQCEAGAFVARHADEVAIVSFYRKALTSVPRPVVRDMRVQYKQWLESVAGQEAVAKMQPAAVDIAKLRSDLDRAPEALAGSVRNKTNGIDKRLEAFAGWVAARPSEAMGSMDELIGDLATGGGSKSHIARSARWMGLQVWRAAFPIAQTLFPGEAQGGMAKRTQTPTDRSTMAMAAAAIEKLIVAQPEAGVKASREPARSQFAAVNVEMSNPPLRVAAAVLYALTDQTAKAAEVIQKQVTYEVQPPRRGWRNPPGGSPSLYPDKPRVVSGPTAGDIRRWAKQTLLILQRSGANEATLESAARAFSSLSAEGVSR